MIKKEKIKTIGISTRKNTCSLCSQKLRRLLSQQNSINLDNGLNQLMLKKMFMHNLLQSERLWSEQIQRGQIIFTNCRAGLGEEQTQY